MAKSLSVYIKQDGSKRKWVLAVYGRPKRVNIGQHWSALVSFLLLDAETLAWDFTLLSKLSLSNAQPQQL